MDPWSPTHLLPTWMAVALALVLVAACGPPTTGDDDTAGDDDDTSADDDDGADDDDLADDDDGAPDDDDGAPDDDDTGPDDDDGAPDDDDVGPDDDDMGPDDDDSAQSCVTMQLSVTRDLSIPGYGEAMKLTIAAFPPGSPHQHLATSTIFTPGPLLDPTDSYQLPLCVPPGVADFDIHIDVNWDDDSCTAGDYYGLASGTAGPAEPPIDLLVDTILTEADCAH